MTADLGLVTGDADSGSQPAARSSQPELDAHFARIESLLLQMLATLHEIKEMIGEQEPPPPAPYSPILDI